MADSPAEQVVEKASRFYKNPIGKKVVMAVTGFIMVAFLVGHVLGNLQIFISQDKINHYSEFLHETPSLLWTARVVLLLSVILHVVAAVQLYRLKAKARGPVAYKKKGRRGASVASLIMLYTGIVLFLFIPFHLAHFTLGWIPLHAFQDIHPYENMVAAFHDDGGATSFVQPLLIAVYVLAMAFLALHLYHGLWSFTQSLGVSHPRYTGRIKAAAIVVGILLALAFAAVPIGVVANLAGFLTASR